MSESEELQRRLCESEMHFRVMFEQAAVGIAYVGIDGRWLQVNQKLCSITGYNSEEMLALSFQDITYPADLDKDLDLVQSLLAGKIQTYTLEKRYLRKEGPLIWVNLTVSLVLDSLAAPLYFIAVIEDIDERKHAEEAEARRVQEARQHMEEFLGVASHELRTPLTTIKANVQLAMRRLRATSPQIKDCHSDLAAKIEAAEAMLWRADRQIEVLNRLVGDMLDISRIRTGKLQFLLRPRICNLATIVQEVVEEQRKAVPNRTILLSRQTAMSMPIMADPDRIAQVLVNYLSNALKYSAMNQPIEVRMQIEGEQVRVEVHNEGKGLSAKEQQRVWECFYQSPESKVLSGSGVGLGLGLHISQILIEEQHGQVGVYSNLDHGSTFWFLLPLMHTEAS